MRLYSTEELENTQYTLKNNYRLYRNDLWIIGPNIDINKIGLTHNNTKDVEHIHIANIKSESFDMNRFEHCSKLKDVTITNTNINHLELKFLNNKNIKKLRLSHNRIEKIDLSPLEKKCELENLDVSYNNLTEINLEPLNKLQKIKRLNVGGNLIEKIKLNQIKDIPIEILNFTTFASEMDFNTNPLYEMKDLIHISYSIPTSYGEEVMPLIEQKKPVTYIKEEHLYQVEKEELNCRCKEIEINNIRHEIWNEKEFRKLENPAIIIRNEIYKKKV